MHLDTTVSTANPTPIPGINSNDATTFPMALAVIDDVPNPATILYKEAVKSSLCSIDRIKYHRSYDLTTDHSGISFITRNSSDHKKDLIISYFMLCNDLAASIHDPEHIKSRK